MITVYISTTPTQAMILWHIKITLQKELKLILTKRTILTTAILEQMKAKLRFKLLIMVTEPNEGIDVDSGWEDTDVDHEVDFDG